MDAGDDLSLGSDGGMVAREYQKNESFGAPTLVRGRVALRPVRPLDYEWLFELETHPQIIHRWRLNGKTPSPEQFQRLLWEGVTAQFLVIERKTNLRFRLVMLYGPDGINGTAQIALVAHPQFFRTALTTDGMVVFLDYVFQCWKFRKLYGESIAFNFGQFATPSAPRLRVDNLFRVEGVLRAHHFFDGSYWDKIITAIYREDWDEQREALLAELDRVALERDGDQAS